MRYFSLLTDGPIVEAKMKLSLLTPRGADNAMFTLSFTVSFGPPSEIACSRNSFQFYSQYSSAFTSAVVSREVIRSHYINSSYPDKTRVIISSQTILGLYSCTVYVTTRTGVSTTNSYARVQLGSGTSTASITGECCTLLTTSLPPPPLSCKPSHCCYGQQEWFQQCSGLLVCPII